MDNEAWGEVTSHIVHHDEDGRAFSFLPLRVIRDGADLFPLELHTHLESPNRAGSAS